MFDFFRNNIKLLMGLLMVLIIPSFVLFGIEGYTGFRETGDVVATVGKTDITRQEWEETHRNAVDRQAASMPGVDRSLLDNEETRRATLERMVNERVLNLAAQEGLFLATDQRLAAQLNQDPTIASLRRPDGTLDVEQYQRLLRAQGMTPEMFEASVRAALSRDRVMQSVAQSVIFTEPLNEKALRAFFERREVQWAQFLPENFRQAVQISPQDLQAFYDKNTQAFKTTEQVDVEYLLLDVEAVSRGIEFTEAELRAFHEQNSVAHAAQQEQRRARHILLTLDPAASPEEKARVQAQAQELLAQLRQSPESFPELARAHSQDPGSAAQGGDLNFFGRGAMVRPFENAVFALQPQQISDVVETEFGLHIIQVTEVRQPPVESFEAARPRLEAELLRQQAQRRFAQAAEEFSNLVYEQSDALAPAADKLGLTVQRFTGLERTGSATSPLLSDPKVLAAVFNAQALASKRNSEALELSGNRLVSVRVLAHRPAQVQPLEAVQAQVRERLLAERSQALARTEGQAKLAAWQAAPASASMSPAAIVSRTDARGMPPRLLAAVMSTPVAADAPGWVGVDLAADGYVVVRVNRVLPREAVEAARAAEERAQLLQLWSQAESQAFMNALRARYQVQVLATSQGTGG